MGWQELVTRRSAAGARTGWDAGPNPRAPALERDDEADVVIVGGGFAGLSTAYHLQRQKPGLRIVLLEAEFVGSGASGRSGGILSSGVGTLYTIGVLKARYGAARAAAIYRATVDAVESVRRMIREEGLDVHLEESGHFKAAWSPSHGLALRQQAETFDALGITGPRYFYPNALREYLGRATPAYYGALRFPESAHLNPARFAVQWKNLLVSRGVRIYEETPVMRLEQGRPLRVITAGGTLRAGQVVVASNSYAPQHGVQRGRIFPMHTYALVTRPLSPGERDRVRWGQLEPVIDTRNCFNYYRFTAEGALFFGGGPVTYYADPADPSSGLADRVETWPLDRLEQGFREAFPELRDVEIAHRWGGPMGFTADTLPIIGPVWSSPGVWFIGGWNGHGVALAGSSGEIMAGLLLGNAFGRKDLPWVRSRRLVIPSDPLRARVLHGILRGLEAIDLLTERGRAPGFSSLKPGFLRFWRGDA